MTKKRRGVFFSSTLDSAFIRPSCSVVSLECVVLLSRSLTILLFLVRLLFQLLVGNFQALHREFQMEREVSSVCCAISVRRNRCTKSCSKTAEDVGTKAEHSSDIGAASQQRTYRPVSNQHTST
ncbi:unnamed protein product [Ectocarpus fasciculatus]